MTTEVEQEEGCGNVARVCAGCGGVVPEIGRRRVFMGVGDMVHDSDECVKLRNDKLDARRAQEKAGPELYEALKNLLDALEGPSRTSLEDIEIAICAGRAALSKALGTPVSGPHD